MSDAVQKSIAIMGIRGVPAAHGGFETFAARLAPWLVENGWKVTVYRPGLALLQAMAEAGGALPTGDGAHVVVLRRGPGAPGRPDAVQVLRLDLPRDFVRQPDRDVALQPFDIVMLPKSDIAVLGTSSINTSSTCCRRSRTARSGSSTT